MCEQFCVSPMMDNKFFTPEEEEILIDLISEYPPLYSHKDEAFKDKELKATIWKKIADSLGKNEETCKTKWKNLRDYYNKKKRVATLNTPGTNSRKYDRYLKMKFLEESDPRSTSNIDTITVSEEENTREEYEHPSMKEITLEYDHNSSMPADDPDGTLDESSSLPYKKAKISSNQRSSRHRILMEYLQASGEERMEMNDEIQSPKNIIMYDDSDETPYATFATAHGDPLEDFFRGIITTVKTFSPELQLRAKRTISNIVFDLEQEALIKAKTSDITINNSR